MAIRKRRWGGLLGVTPTTPLRSTQPSCFLPPQSFFLRRVACGLPGSCAQQSAARTGKRGDGEGTREKWPSQPPRVHFANLPPPFLDFFMWARPTINQISISYSTFLPATKSTRSNHCQDANYFILFFLWSRTGKPFISQLMS